VTQKKTTGNPMIVGPSQVRSESPAIEQANCRKRNEQWMSGDEAVARRQR
jgi:hypothetical protein